MPGYSTNDHFGLDEVKDRILEHLAVLKLKGDLKSPILVPLRTSGSRKNIPWQISGKSS
jgi:ATP-dependent Lon protease